MLTNRMRTSAICVFSVVAVVLLAGTPGLSKDKYEKISGRMYGTSTQLGRNASLDFTIYRASTPEEREVLVQAFKKGQSQGLADALSKMKSVGRIAITGTVGYDVNFIRIIPTETGRKIRFVTNRRIAFGEVRQSTRSKDYDLTAGEIDLNDREPKKSTGTLLPATQIIVNKEGDIQFDLYQNPWRIDGITDWKPKEKEGE
jgi:hypothetical protein